MNQANLFCQKIAFQDWPNNEIPRVAAGVYAIWHNDQLIYCGMSGREVEKYQFSNSKKKYGLVTRLASHASGRLSGDQFCVYVANRLVIPDLKQADLEAFRDGKQTLDALTKKYIHQNFVYQYCLLESSQEAYSLEAQCRHGDVFGTVPLLNPAS
ncbi:hypothetical protein OAC90_00205 [Planktomarina sp.]|nr:hypothetical protein [Planktomarina sp.]